MISHSNDWWQSYRENHQQGNSIENVVMVCIILHIVFESLSVSGTPCKWSVHARNCAGFWKAAVDKQRLAFKEMSL